MVNPKKLIYHDFNDNETLQSESISPGIYYPKNKPSHRCRPPGRGPGSNRIVFRNGEFNIDNDRFRNRRFRLSNWFVTMVEARWRWTLINFFIAYTLDWMFFGSIYWIIALWHGDLEESTWISYENGTEWVPCVENIYGFTSSFLFSIEVHTTVAYGRRSITLECPQAIIAMCLQCILSSIFQAFMVGILFAKLTRPKRRAHTILFSKNAVIHLRNDKFCFVFRVGDIRKARILNTKAMVYVIRMNNSPDSVLDDCEQIELKTEFDGNESAFFLWPLSVVHIIDKNSPLYKISAADILCGTIEILVVFEGVIETTGQPIQARSSYTQQDILWGHRFISMFDYCQDKDYFDVDFSKLNYTVRIDTPLCSAAEYDGALDCITEECF